MIIFAFCLKVFSTTLTGVDSIRMIGINVGPSSGRGFGDPDIDVGNITESVSGKGRELSRKRRCRFIYIISV